MFRVGVGGGSDHDVREHHDLVDHDAARPATLVTSRPVSRPRSSHQHDRGKTTAPMTPPPRRPPARRRPGGPCELLTAKKLLLKAKDGSPRRASAFCPRTRRSRSARATSRRTIPCSTAVRCAWCRRGRRLRRHLPASGRSVELQEKGRPEPGLQVPPDLTDPISADPAQQAHQDRRQLATGLGHTLGADPQLFDMRARRSAGTATARASGTTPEARSRSRPARRAGQDARAPTVCGAPARSPLTGGRERSSCSAARTSRSRPRRCRAGRR